MAALDIVDQVLEWNSRAPETGCSAHDIRVDHNCGIYHRSIVPFAAAVWRALFEVLRTGGVLGRVSLRVNNMGRRSRSGWNGMKKLFKRMRLDVQSKDQEAKTETPA